ncbi:TnsA endonuclease N-terminal domain-containing protein [Lysinibacillus sp. NPDC094177]|uniref:TnsA endonuclease N-terminal domain-containing protein n=1 Tax=Lysinibacillus sp. NPDC094177 TaxID=3390580 RepID=UPI003D09243D
MSKRKYGWSEDKRSRYIKEGRGQGELSNYIPWIKIQDISSRGNVSRLMGWTTMRQHEFLSNLERDYFSILDWEDSVVDIREQFPLNLETTLRIAEEKGIKHSTDNITGIPFDMTTDFFITVIKNTEKKYIARTVKPSKQLEDERIIEKFEIEREYWESRGIDWGIVTEKEIPKQLASNILWVHKFYYLAEEDLSYSTLLLRLLDFKEGSEEKLLAVCNRFDEDYNLETGSALSYVKHFIARKYISVDMNKKINPSNLSINQIILNISKEDNIDYDIS